MVVVPEGDPGDEMRRLIASRSVDAFLLSDRQPDDPRVRLLAEAGMPFACFGRTGPTLPQNWVDIDNRGAAATDRDGAPVFMAKDAWEVGYVTQRHPAIRFTGELPRTSVGKIRKEVLRQQETGENAPGGNP